MSGCAIVVQKPVVVCPHVWTASVHGVSQLAHDFSIKVSIDATPIWNILLQDDAL